ncbi:hypothetical protein NDA11_006129 [Ustilago hordei]|uniref:ERCC4 domain-containing protein n=1 Tax=Ustilago hordei TaxID=120017 RepID=I2FRW6_USTHO|nr:uncharacterized protein UHO2_07309 [Ustilago hordei]KAJ1045063.1 hypothetical protein NDA10_003721 [Ustilago hordei]KAJ1573566.1 hypothetical protein NDA11_006129 [Ustilago hordei]KAJ1594376.1 hypothetical protein NDA12_001494 [Ustilago hordei]CCF49659.1 uncharacterized protein UHOR_03171 [Ustilago hordei]SYW87172.1 uncharacterized protein UHO2_07309 [Ustilago hordei]
MVGALWIHSGSDSDSDSEHRRTRRSQDVRTVTGPSKLEKVQSMRKSPRRGNAASSGSIIALSSSQDIDRASKSSKQSTADKLHPSQISNPTPGQRMARLLADPSPDTSLPSFRDLLRSRSGATTSNTTEARNGAKSGAAPVSSRAGTLRRTASQPVSSSQEEGPSSFLPNIPTRRDIRKAATNVTATRIPEVIEIGSDSIVDPASEADPLPPLDSSPIRSQFSARGQSHFSSSQPVAYSPPKARNRPAGGGEGVVERRTARQSYRAESTPIVILSSSPPPAASLTLPRASQNGGRRDVVEDIPEEDMELPELPPSSFPDEVPLRSPSSPLRLERREVVDVSPSLKRRAAATSDVEGSKEAPPAPAPKRSRPMGRTTSLLDALDNLYIPHDTTTAVSSKDVQTTDRIKDTSSKLPSKAAKAAAAKQAREQKAIEREAAKAHKLRLATEKKKFLEANRLRTSKSDTMRELIIDLDRTLFTPGQPLDKQEETVKARFEEEGAEVNMCAGLVEPPLLRFRRKCKADWDEGRRCWVPFEAGRVKVRREGMVVLVMEAKEIIRIMSEAMEGDGGRGGEEGEEGLERWYGDLKRRLEVLNGDRGAEEQVFLICQGLVRYYSRLRANENRAYTARIRQQLAESDSTTATTANPADRADAAPKGARRKATCAPDPLATSSTVPPQAVVERALLTLKLMHRCYVIHASSLVDSIEWLHQLTSDLSLKPYKMLRDSHLSFAVDTGRNTTSSSASAIYMMMLQQIPRVTPAIAQSIATVYPSLQSLVKAYERCQGDEKQERGLLAGVQVQSNKDGTERRGNRMNLGKELSKRIREVVRGRNGDVVVSHSSKD